MAGGHYEIVVKGLLVSTLLRWFEELEVRSDGPGTTTVSGWFVDQAALQGVLNQLGDLGLELSSVRRLPDDQARDVPPRPSPRGR